jgi:hypothetical protein
VRGPFDIAERMSNNQAPSLPLETATRPSSPLVSTFSGISRSFMPRSNSILTYLQYENHSRGTGVGNSHTGGSSLGDRSGILLNREREDLCWDCLFMVCGGTGITPMLQLVS